MTFCSFLRAQATLGSILIATTIMPAVLAASPVPASPGYPGDVFDWPSGVDGYGWLADLTGVTTLPTPVVDFVVTNIFGAPLIVEIFQIFGNCNETSAAFADFDLFIDGMQTPWSVVDVGPCLYHNYLNFALPVGDTRFMVKLTNDRDTAPLIYADVRFGNGPTVILAIPLPPPAALLLCGVGAIALVRRRRAF